LRFLQGWEMFIRHSIFVDESLRSGMRKRLRRCYGGSYLHFITSSCYHRRPILGTAQRRSLFLEVLDQVRRRYSLVVVGYVVMPEHFHLLISEPEKGTPSTVMQVLKQRFARKILKRLWARSDPAQGQLWDEVLAEGQVWHRRFYDFVVWSHAKRLKKLRYIHPQSGKTRVGAGAGAMVLEQFSTLCLSRSWPRSRR
jgi:putative transposase